MATRKKPLIKRQEPTQLIQPQGTWYAVIDDESVVSATPVVLWATTPSGVIGLVSLPGDGLHLASPTEDCVGYVLVRPDQKPEDAAYQYYEQLEEEESEDEEGEDDGSRASWDR